MSEGWSFFTVQITLIAVVLILHTYMGLHVIRRTIIFCDLVLDQLAALGMLGSIAVGTQYATGSSYVLPTLAVFVGAFLLAVINPRTPLIPREAVIGIMFAMALVATLLLGDKLSGGDAYVTKTLSGAMLWANWQLVAVTAAVYVVLLLIHYRFRRQFIALTDNPESLRHRKYWDFLFFATQGVITVLIVPIAGVLLAYAFLMIPAAIAAMFSKGWLRAVVLGWSIGFAACVVGLVLSYNADLPYGPTLVLALGVCFGGAILIRSATAASVGPRMRRRLS
ncbi:MAG TPA: metal ABC transporter permease [Acidobacteriota bacterium]|nr:metal ABC transporter permease [Acidobacteriota bacterium]